MAFVICCWAGGVRFAVCAGVLFLLLVTEATPHPNSQKTKKKKLPTPKQYKKKTPLFRHPKQQKQENAQDAPCERWVSRQDARTLHARGGGAFFHSPFGRGGVLFFVLLGQRNGVSSLTGLPGLCLGGPTTDQAAKKTWVLFVSARSNLYLPGLD